MVSNLRQKPIYRIFLWLLLILCVILLWRVGGKVLMDPTTIMVQDFGQFYAAGKLNLQGGNPYHPDNIHELKMKLIGSSTGSSNSPFVSVLYAPPWTLVLAMPFSLLPYPVSRLAWLLANIIILLVCARLLWDIYGGSKGVPRLAWIVVLLFAPVLLVLSQGQLTLLVLLGVVVFLYFVEYRRYDLLAGAAAALISIKPQLFYLFWIALLVWCIDRRRWKVLLGLALTAAGAAIIALMANPQVINQYLQLVLNYSPSMWLSPTIGTYLRLLFGWDRFWLQFLPTALGLVWFLFYWFKRRKQWRWSEDMPILVFVSILTMSYGWTYDYVLLLVAIVPAVILLVNHRTTKTAWILVSAFLLINLLYLIPHHFFKEQYFGWLAPALFLWYLLVIKFSDTHPRTPDPQSNH